MLLFAPGNSELLKNQHMSMNFEELQQGIQEIPLFGQRARKAASSQEQAALAPNPAIRRKDRQPVRGGD